MRLQFRLIYTSRAPEIANLFSLTAWYGNCTALALDRRNAEVWAEISGRGQDILCMGDIVSASKLKTRHSGIMIKTAH